MMNRSIVRARGHVVALDDDVQGRGKHRKVGGGGGGEGAGKKGHHMVA